MRQISVGQQPFEFSIRSVLDAGAAQRRPGAASARIGTVARCAVVLKQLLSRSRRICVLRQRIFADACVLRYSFQPPAIGCYQGRGRDIHGEQECN